MNNKVKFNGRKIPVNASESLWSANDGWLIRRIDIKANKQQPDSIDSIKPKGSLLFLPGRGDHYEKYLETLVQFSENGLNVTAIDWRGQGLSGRLLADQNVGYIDDFSTWIDDLTGFYEKWAANNVGPHIVVAHSMGGHLAVRALAEKKINPDMVILSAPMLSMQSGGMPRWFNHFAVKMMVALGRGEKPAWKVSEKPLSPESMRSRILTHDAERYDDEIFWWGERPEVKLGPGSWHWVERAMQSVHDLDNDTIMGAIKTPTLILATTNDKLVDTGRIIKDAKRMPNAKLVLYGKEAAHELLREADPVRDKVMGEIFDFIQKHS
ncbi:lysophospholipase [Sphingorhabdus lutea]|uniref:Lysophospholipase n=1 Tax=Sphingorhabdus lutea TaxID=1913578 RepID=A0A1L3JCY4_9SPHN|nr:alpha/beta hydrolase [Sphingorhabdus lutea]APG62995.1 lysophospholipase [Sphingorhabdus lutea]